MDINKFNWKEVFNNNNGKTSASGVSGVILVLVAVLSILNVNVLIWMSPSDALKFIEQIVLVILIASSLLGVRKWISKNDLKNTTNSTGDASTGMDI